MSSRRLSERVVIAGVVLGLVLTVACGGVSAVAGSATQSSWWDDDWEHRTPLTVTERSGTALSDYPVVTEPVDVGSASPASIRVVNETSGTVLDFAVREREGGYQLAFKTGVGAGGTNDHLAVYYGNPDAESAAIPWERARYNLYDGFDDGSLHPDWEVESGEWVESDGTLRPSPNEEWGGGVVRELDAPLDQSRTPIYWEARVTSRSTGGGQDLRRARLRNADGDGHRLLFVRTFQTADDGVGVDIGWDSPDSRKLLRADQFAVGDPLREEVLLGPDGNVDALVENEDTGATGSRTYEYAETYEYTHVELSDNGGQPGAEWDYVLLRYRVSPEPAVTVGAAGPSTGTPGADAEGQTPPSTPTDREAASGGDVGGTETRPDVRDSDGDGVIDSEDYAPRDPDVQEKSDLEATAAGSGPGLGVVAGLVAVVLAGLVGARRR